MPENNTPAGTPVGMPDPVKNNAEVAAKQAAQDIGGQSTVTGDFGEATDALDKLAAQVKPADVTPVADAPPKKDDAGAPPPAAPVPDAEAIKRAEELKHAEEFFKDSPKLPPNASPKSSEAFSSIKVKAAQEISAREQQIAELKKQIDAAKNPTTETLQKEKELEELRQWRAKVDVDFDPKFKEYDKTVEQSREFIYAQLAKSPAFPPEVIAQIKKYGGPDKVNLVKLFATANDPTLQRMVESKVADIHQTTYNRDKAIESAKSNLASYTQERSQASQKESAARVQEVTSHLSNMLGSFDWMTDRKADAGADEAAKKEIEAHNAFVAQTKSEVQAAMTDESPQMRAILIAGYAKLVHLQRTLPVVEARAAKAEKALADVTAKWEAVKNSSRSRLEQSAAPAGGIQAAPKSGADVNQRPGDALDTLARQVMEKRAQAAAGQ